MTKLQYPYDRIPGEIMESDEATAGEAAWAYFRQYAAERPEVVVLWALGIGFVLGWRLKPW
ncbi:MAG: hypothetical protein AB7F89_14875 [Pirellulaceae bacterium]